MLLWRAPHAEEHFIERVEEPERRYVGSRWVPIKGLIDLAPRERTDAKRTHLAELSQERRVNVRLGLTGLWRRISVGLATVQLSCERVGDRSRAGGIEAIP